MRRPPPAPSRACDNDRMTPATPRLSPKERWVLHFQRLGLTPEQTAQRMRVSPFTVRVHLENARVKLER
jgi:DNA-binding CsgD family transcriptional regulator